MSELNNIVGGGGQINLLLRRRMMMQKMGILPSGFQEVKYLKSSGTQYINTGISAVNAYNIKIVLSVDSEQWDAKIFGCDKVPIGIIGPFHNNVRVVFYGYQPNTVTIPEDADFHTYEIGANGIVIDDVKYSDYNYLGTRTDGLTFALFGASLTGGVGYGKGKIKLFNVVQDGEEILNLIPCYRKSDNKPGMYDTVSGEFFVNQGTGEFGYEKLDGTIIAPE